MHPLAKLLRFDWLNTNIISAIPIFIATNIAMVIIWHYDISKHSMPLILGIIAGGLVDLDNRLTGRLKNIFFTLIAFTISSLSAQLALSHGWLFLPIITAISFITIMLGALGQRYNTIAFGTLLVALYTTLSYTPQSAWYSNTIMILSGTLLYGFTAVLVYLLFPNRAVQENMAKCFDALNHYLLAKAAFFDPDNTDDLEAKQIALANADREVITAFEQTRVSLFYRLRGQHRHLRTQRMLRYYFCTQDILERASSNYYQYNTLFSELRNSDLVFRFQRILELQAMACRHIAYSLRYNQPYHHNIRGDRALNGLTQSLNYHRAQGLPNIYKWLSITENLRNIERQLNQLSDENILNQPFNKTLPKTTRLMAENVSGLRNMIAAIRSQCTFNSQLFRHAVRLSIVVFICSSIVEIFQIPQGYWILLTAVLVSQPNYSATKKRLIQRVIGTILGVFFALSLRYFSPTLEAELGIIVIASTLFFFFRSNNYSFSTFFITIQVLVSFEIMGFALDYAMLPRIFDTLIGAGVAWFAVSYLWPDWKYLNLHNSIKATLHACAIYLRHITAQLQFGYRNQLSYRIARRTAQNSLSALSTTISNMHSEPQKYREALTFAPNLLGLTYTLLGYISALGSYRTLYDDIHHKMDFCSLFYPKAKEISLLLEQMEQSHNPKHQQKIERNIAIIDQQLKEYETQYNQQINTEDEQPNSILLIQQLRLIVQLLPSLLHFTELEQKHHRASLNE